MDLKNRKTKVDQNIEIEQRKKFFNCYGTDDKNIPDSIFTGEHLFFVSEVFFSSQNEIDIKSYGCSLLFFDGRYVFYSKKPFNRIVTVMGLIFYLFCFCIKMKTEQPDYGKISDFDLINSLELVKEKDFKEIYKHACLSCDEFEELKNKDYKKIIHNFFMKELFVAENKDIMKKFKLNSEGNYE